MSGNKKPAGAGGQRGNGGQPLQGNYTTKTLPVFNENGRVVGHIENGVLRKTVKRSHQLQRPAAWGWDTAIIDQAERAGVRFTELTDENGRVWRASLADFRRHGVRVNRGFGAQVALPLSFWQVRKVGETAVSQLSLFEGLL